MHFITIVSSILEGSVSESAYSVNNHIIVTMKYNAFKPWACPSKTGFSLVEVTLATSIMALAVTSVLGLVPFGISNVREAGERTAVCHIHRVILGRMNLTRWLGENGQDYLNRQYDGKKFYFDDQGMEVPESEVRNGAWFSYVAQVKVHPQDVSLPAVRSGANQVLVHDLFLRRVTLLIAPVTDPDIELTGMPVMSVKKYSSLLVRSEA